MFRFSIRDVFWLTVVVGLAVAWVVEHRQHAKYWRNEVAAERVYFDQLAEVVKVRAGWKVAVDRGGVGINFPDGSAVSYPRPSYDLVP